MQGRGSAKKRECDEAGAHRIEARAHRSGSAQKRERKEVGGQRSGSAKKRERKEAEHEEAGVQSSRSARKWEQIGGKDKKVDEEKKGKKKEKQNPQSPNISIYHLTT